MPTESGRAGAGSMYGSLEMLILKALSLGGPMHGLAIATMIVELSEEALRVEEGALYPALHRLARKGYVEREWRVSDRGRRARFYDLTESGREALHAEVASWSKHHEAVGRIIAVRRSEQS